MSSRREALVGRLEQAWHDCLDGERLYGSLSRILANPALADLLEDFARVESLARSEIERLLQRAETDPPSPSAWRGLQLAVAARWRALLGDEATAEAALHRERLRLARLEPLIDRLQEAGADPEALQRLAEIATSIRQRIHVFAEIAGRRGKG